MTEIRYGDDFEKVFKKLDNSFKIKIKKQIVKIIENSEIGKPLKYSRKNTREVYISPMRLYYCYSKDEDTENFSNKVRCKEKFSVSPISSKSNANKEMVRVITILELSHKKGQ